MGSQLEVIILVNGVMNNVGFSPVSGCRSKTGRFEQQAVLWFVGITCCGLHLSMVAASPLTIVMRPGLWCFVKRSGSPSLLKSLNPVSSCFFIILHISSSISVAVELILIWR